MGENNNNNKKKASEPYSAYGLLKSKMRVRGAGSHRWSLTPPHSKSQELSREF